MNKKFARNYILMFLLYFPLYCYGNSDVSLDNGLRITSSDGQHKFHLGGYLLFDVYAIDDTENSFERFDMFNAWLHIVGSSYDTFDYKIQYSLEDASTTKLRDAYIAYRFTPRVKLKLGQYDMPTIAEHLSSLTYTTFSGRGIVDSLTPGRDVGMQLETSSLNNNWHYYVGLFNGNGIDANGEDNNSKDIAARATGIIYEAVDSGKTAIYADASFTYGKQDKDNIRFRSESGETMLAASAVPVDDRLRLAGGLYAYNGSSSLKIVYLKNSYDLLANQTGEASAWSVMFAHFLSGEREIYKSGLFQKLTPNHNYVNGEGGAWQFAVRYSAWQADDTLVQAAGAGVLPTVEADKAKALSLGVNWILNPNARINTSWIRTEFDQLASSTILTNTTQDALMARFTLQFF